MSNEKDDDDDIVSISFTHGKCMQLLEISVVSLGSTNFIFAPPLYTGYID